MEERNYAIYHLPITITERPTDEQFTKVSKLVKEPINVTLDEFACLIVPPNSFPWSGGIYRERRSGSNWISQQLIGLDFDKQLISISGVIERLKEKGIRVNMWYSTLRSTPDAPRFGVIICLDEPVTDKHECLEILRGLHALFPEADKKCKELARWFLPGKDSIILDYNPNNKKTIMDSCGMLVIANDAGRKRYITEGSPHTGTFSFSLYNYIREEEKLPTNSNNNILKRGIEIDIDSLRPKCKILDDFMNGVWLYENELFGLFSNMIYISGGAKMMHRLMKQFNLEGKTEYKNEYFSIASYIKRKGYYPQSVGNFSDRPEDAGLPNLLELALRKKGKVEIIEPVQRISLSDAEKRLKEMMASIVQSDYTNIHIIKCPT